MHLQVWTVDDHHKAASTCANRGECAYNLRTLIQGEPNCRMVVAVHG